MSKFRKKPVVIDAVLFRAGEQDSDLAADVVAGRIRYSEDGTMLIETLEGTMIARPGDWIIRGVKGELYPCKPDIFAATYELADPTEAPGYYCEVCPHVMALHYENGDCPCGVQCSKELPQ